MTRMASVSTIAEPALSNARDPVQVASGLNEPLNYTSPGTLKEEQHTPSKNAHNTNVIPSVEHRRALYSGIAVPGEALLGILPIAKKQLPDQLTNPIKNHDRELFVDCISTSSSAECERMPKTRSLGTAQKFLELSTRAQHALDAIPRPTLADQNELKELRPSIALEAAHKLCWCSDYHAACARYSEKSKIDPHESVLDQATRYQAMLTNFDKRRFAAERDINRIYSAKLALVDLLRGNVPIKLPEHIITRDGKTLLGDGVVVDLISQRPGGYIMGTITFPLSPRHRLIMGTDTNGVGTVCCLRFHTKPNVAAIGAELECLIEIGIARKESAGLDDTSRQWLVWGDLAESNSEVPSSKCYDQHLDSTCRGVTYEDKATFRLHGIPLVEISTGERQSLLLVPFALKEELVAFSKILTASNSPHEESSISSITADADLATEELKRFALPPMHHKIPLDPDDIHNFCMQRLKR